MSEIIVRSKEIRMVSIDEIRLNPKNRNTHSKEQIDRLAKIIAYQGFRDPGTISNRTGILVAGEGRYLAAKKLGMKEIPVIFQDFDDEIQETAHGISDNAIHEWSMLDKDAIKDDLSDFGTDFDLNLLGMQDFQLLDPNFEPGDESDQGQLDQKKPVQCPNCGEQFVPKN